MSYDVALPLLRTRFAEQWAIARPTVPVQMPNSAKSFDGSAFVRPQRDPYARLSFLSDRGTEIIAAGDDAPRRLFGRMQLEILVAVEAGDLLAYRIAEDFAAIWRGHPLAGFLFYEDAQVIPVGRAFDDDTRSKYDVWQPWEYEFVPQ